MPELEIATPGVRRSPFLLVYDRKADAPLTAEAEMLRAMILSYTGADIRTEDSARSSSREIVLASQSRPETAEMRAELREGEFAIRTQGDGEQGKVFLAATTYRSFVACAEYLLDTYYTREKGLCIPTNVDVKGHEKEYAMITTDIEKLRDPCILSEDGVYYAYGTGWTCYKNTSGKLDGPWMKVGKVASVADEACDGGHGMIFTDTNGQMYLSFHSPNTAEGNRKERPTFLAVREENGTLVWDEPQ